MRIEMMKEDEKQKILEYMLPYEKFSLTLYAEILHDAKSIFVLRGHFNEIHGVFSFIQGITIHHCLPNIYGKNLIEIQNAFLLFFNEHTPKFLFSIVGEETGTKFLKEFISKNFFKSVKSQINYFLMEEGRFDSKKSIQKANRQLVVEKCAENDFDKIFEMQVAFEKEEVVIDGFKFDEDACRERFELFLDAGAVYAGKIKNVPLCKLTVNAVGKNYALLAGIYTLEKYRNHGLAKTLVDCVCQKFHTQQKKCILFAKVNNLPALKVYDECGFRKICNFCIIYFDKEFKR
ncbi:GNAT family N-acetyltransferase [Treponema pectinovorum]|uniref:GNAT family N-acetyltransferase n=1 Tax=Treponema pectinovorum TaxID=164 RepID=UPI003D8B0300